MFYKDQVLLKRLRLGFYTVGLIFFIHALPGFYLQEMFPIVRWTMYAPSAPPPSEFRTQEFLHVIDSNCQTHELETGQLFVVPSSGGQNASRNLVQQAFVNNDPAFRLEQQQMVANQYETTYQVKPIAIQLVIHSFAFKPDEFPHFDMNKTDKKTVVASVGVNLTIEHTCTVNELHFQEENSTDAKEN